MNVHPLTVLGTFPVTQQLTGGVQALIGIIATIASFAKCAFRMIQLLSISQSNWNGNNRSEHRNFVADKLHEAVEDLKVNAEMLGLGLVTFIPVVGTVYNAIQWSKQAKPQYNVIHPRAVAQNWNLNSPADRFIDRGWAADADADDVPALL